MSNAFRTAGRRYLIRQKNTFMLAVMVTSLCSWLIFWFGE